jgi:PIN domain nuclease of toxin-antitoxin system
VGRRPALGGSCRSGDSISRECEVVSAASIWEAEIKAQLGKLKLEVDLAGGSVAHGFEPLEITFAHTAAAGRLPPHHGDPFDRMLVAQAQLEGLTIVSRDPVFDRYSVAVLRA